MFIIPTREIRDIDRSGIFCSSQVFFLDSSWKYNEEGVLKGVYL